MAINSRFGIGKKDLVFRILVILIFVLNLSFTKKITPDHLASEPVKLKFLNINFMEQNILMQGQTINSFSASTNDFKHSSSDLNITLPFFPVIYFGNGVDHMSINLVNLNSTGLLIGDEIGIFDSIYCVGSAVISEMNLTNNGLSIPASANDTIPGSRNGYIEGHHINLKLYRSGNIYKLYFELVNNSRNIFEKWGSMFAFVDFSKSTGSGEMAYSASVNVYPNPFSETIHIDIALKQKQFLNCEIRDVSGHLVRTLFQGEVESREKISWNALDNHGQKVPSGIYFCLVNQTSVKIVYKSLSDH